jgi:malate dehydrogenase (oxaloacetate-decarboxylating)
MLNKGSVFTPEERMELGLTGLLPTHPSSMGEQLARVYENYQRKDAPLERYIFLAALQDRNEVLFYRLLTEHIAELMPIIYTPTVGTACEFYSHIYRRPRGLYLSYPDRHRLDDALSHIPYPDVCAIVVTDGERILGLGDQGIGGVEISIGKLALYSLCAGIHPATTLPMVLDVGTNNRRLLEDPLYLGWRHERIRGKEYDDFIELFVQAVLRRFPNVLLQWEDFAKNNAARLLERYQERLCTFNDDIQGTGAVTLAGLLAAADATGTPLRRHRFVMHGAGSAAHGICDQLVVALRTEGDNEAEARARIWLVDSEGLVHDRRANLDSFKRRYARPFGETAAWKLDAPGNFALRDVVRNVRPSALIGTSAQPGDFSEALVRDMAAHAERPIIFPLSNPTSKSEAVPADLLTWTDGRALIATGSPFADVMHDGRTVKIGQCNNVFIFPGLSLGVIATGIRRIPHDLFVSAAQALSTFAPMRQDPNGPLYPPAEQVRQVSRAVALAVALEAQRAGLAEPLSEEEVTKRIDNAIWYPHYPRYVAVRP